MYEMQEYNWLVAYSSKKDHANKVGHGLKKNVWQ